MIDGVFGYPVYISEFGTVDLDINKYKISRIPEWNATSKSNAMVKDKNGDVICRKKLNEHTKYMINILGIENLELTFNSCGDPNCNTCSDFWINKYECDDYQGVHTHDDINRNILFSFTYFLKYDKDVDASFLFENFAPRHAICTEMENVFPFFESLKPDVNEGDIMIFPSWMKHSVDTHKNKDVDRITIAGNLYKVNGNVCNRSNLSDNGVVIYELNEKDKVIFKKNDIVCASYISWDDVMKKFSYDIDISKKFKSIGKNNELHNSFVCNSDYYPGNISNILKRVSTKYTYKNVHMYVSLGNNSDTFGRHNDDVDVLIVQSIGTMSYRFDNGYVCNLNPSDSLFIPKGVFHEPIVCGQRVTLSFGSSLS